MTIQPSEFAKFATALAVAKYISDLQTNMKTLKAGYHYGETTETFTTTYNVEPAPMEKGTYRSIMGNQALVMGLVTASKKSGLPLFYGSYPITPASDILHGLAGYKNFGVKTFQAEDEIAAICSAIGASYAGSLGITSSSGPGIALKTEAMGLAISAELPLVVLRNSLWEPLELPSSEDLLSAAIFLTGESLRELARALRARASSI